MTSVLLYLFDYMSYFCLWRNEFSLIEDENSYYKVHLKLGKLLSLPRGFAGVASMCSFFVCFELFFVFNLKTGLKETYIIYTHLMLQRFTLYSFRGQTPLDMHLLYVGL